MSLSNADLRSTGALSSSGQAPFSVSGGPHPPASPRFGFSPVSGALFNPRVVNLFHALDQKDSMVPVAARDAVDSSGRVVAEFQRHKLSGIETLTEESITCLVWGFGIKFCKDFYDNAVGWMARKGKSPLQLPKLDVDLLPKTAETLAKGFHQQLTPDMVQKYVLVDNALKHSDPARYARQLAAKTHLLSLADPLKDGALQNAYKSNALRKLSVTALAPTLAVAIGIPALYQWMTRMSLARQTKKAAAKIYLPPKAVTANPVQTYGQSMGNPGGMVPNVFDAFMSSNAPTHNTISPRFSGMQTRLASEGVQTASKTLHPMVNKLLENEVLSTAMFVDVPLASARAGMALHRNVQDMIEKIIKEAVLITVIFWGQRAIQDQLNKGFNTVAGTATELEFKTLKHLADHFSQDTSGFLKAHKNSLKHLGEAIHSPAALVESIQQYIHTKYQTPQLHQPNLLLDLAELSGKIPVVHAWDRGLKKSVPQTIDITQKIKLGDIEQMIRKLGTIAQTVEKTPGASLKGILEKTAASKYAAFTLSSVACWMIMSHWLPKFQHWITYLQTGDRHYYPGLGNPDQTVLTKWAALVSALIEDSTLTTGKSSVRRV